MPRWLFRGAIRRPLPPSLSAVYVIKGTIFFFITDAAVNRSVPSNAALQSQASNVLGRLG
jgi:hypothetical protein